MSVIAPIGSRIPARVLTGTYKQTEVGSLPKDWDVLNIGELEPFVTSGSRGWAKYYSDIGDPFLRITNMSRATIYLDLSDLKFVQLPARQSEAERTQLRSGDILISITADIGIIGYVDSRIPLPAYINQHIALVRFDPARTENKFVSYFLASEGPQKLFRSLTDQGAKAGMSLLTIRKIAIAHPSLGEQRAISTALSDVDALIRGLDKLIAKKRAIKLGSAQQLLTGKIRLNPFGPSCRQNKNTDVGCIPADWEVKRLGDIGRCHIGLTFSPDCVAAEGHFVLRASNIGDYGLQFEDKLCVRMPIPEELVLREQDLLICVRNGSRPLIGKCALVDSRAKGMTFGAFMSVFRSPRNRFAFHYFQSEMMKHQIHEHLGATINQITNKSLNSFHIALPPEDEQDAIASVLFDMDAEIMALERQRTKAVEIKQGMMQQLLTGRTRLI